MLFQNNACENRNIIVYITASTRIAKKDLNALKVKAVKEGLPYQTLVPSILHKYLSGRLVEKRS